MLNKPPPHSLEAEQAVIGGCLVNNDAIDESLSPSCFYSSKHQAIWGAILALQDAQDPVDMLTVAEKLKSQHADKPVGLGYLSGLSSAVPSYSTIEHYTKIVKDLAYQRRVLIAAMQLVDSSSNGTFDPEADLSAFDAAIVNEAGTEAKEIGELLLGRLDHYERLYRGDEPPGLETGFYNIDEQSPLKKKRLLVLAGRPGMGKTALALSLSLGVAKAGKKVLFVSLEMPTGELVDRAIAQAARVDSRKMETGKFLDSDWPKIQNGMATLNKLGIRFIDGTAWGYRRIRQEAARVQRKHGLDLLVVDHLHEMKEPEAFGRKDLEVGESIKGLKDTAKILNIPVISLAQLNRSVESRDLPKPTMADLREAGKIEEVADTIWLIYRQDYYEDKLVELQESKRCKTKLVDDRLKGVGRIYQAKARQGSTGYFDLEWNGPYAAYSNLTRRY